LKSKNRGRPWARPWNSTNSSAPDDQTRARLIAEAFERMEERYPEITDLATASQVRESELRLQKEIEQVRAELKSDIAQTKSDTIKWTAGMLTVQLGLFGALVKLLVG
jgi:molecular chaperone GrpE (heat shock protein)